MNIVSFSGGKDSTAMLLMMLEKEIPVDRIICVDTTKEFPQMYEHIKKVQAMIEPLKIEVVKIDFDYFFADKEIMRGANKGKFGYGWTGARGRWCTHLKVAAINKIIKKIPNAPNTVEFVGIAYDEVKRAEKKYIKEKNVRLPLVEWQITERQALDYCYSKGLDWGGLYEKFHRVSCWCCPLSRIGSLRTLYNDFPELWKELEEMDKKSWRNFKSNYTVTELREKFANENI
jgi:3'-phosphoadenosine 5'-phosphosulfate sulfotransferase (PAPS reductase)/FAD synthetase